MKLLVSHLLIILNTVSHFNFGLSVQFVMILTMLYFACTSQLTIWSNFFFLFFLFFFFFRYLCISLRKVSVQIFYLHFNWNSDFLKIELQGFFIYPEQQKLSGIYSAHFFVVVFICNHAIYK
jgi:hypothetical protein